MKSAYIIVTNSISEVFKASLCMLDDAMNDIYILFDKKAKIASKEDEIRKYVNKSNLSFCEQIVNWGGYSQIDAVLTLLKEVKRSQVEYDYIHFFQGSDLPIKSQKDIWAFFSENKGREFVSIEFERSEMAINKCRYYHFFCHNRFFRSNKFIKIINFGLVYLQKILNIKTNTDIDVYQGSALFSITPEFASYLIQKEQEIKHRFRFSLAADECFLQTMIMNSIFKDRIYINKMGKTFNARLIDRTRPDGKNSPHVWRDFELEFIAKQPRDICFARKFDAKIGPQIIEDIRNLYM